MSTANQIAANQRNAQLSTGPVTPQGKEKTSQNATTHGLTSTRVMANEVTSFEQFLNGLSKEFDNAETASEHGYIRRLAELQVRIDRANAAEVSVMNLCIAKLMESEPEIAFEDALGRIFMDKESASQIRLVLRYQSQVNRAYRQTRRELEQMIEARLIAAEAARQAEAASVQLESGANRAAAVQKPSEIGSVSQSAPARAVNQTSSPSRT
jgi:hypothetical protein